MSPLPIPHVDEPCAGPQKAIAPTADEYTPPPSPVPDIEAPTPAVMAKVQQRDKNMALSMPKLNEKIMALPVDIKKATEPR